MRGRQLPRYILPGQGGSVSCSVHRSTRVARTRVRRRAVGTRGTRLRSSTRCSGSSTRKQRVESGGERSCSRMYGRAPPHRVILTYAQSTVFPSRYSWQPLPGEAGHLKPLGTRLPAARRCRPDALLLLRPPCFGLSAPALPGSRLVHAGADAAAAAAPGYYRLEAARRRLREEDLSRHRTREHVTESALFCAKQVPTFS
ncbi:hypothetical protein T492DRAFT_968735 [Pavlovales sp. CCMP2436]|nr:hypothetical protein T492DRAFT_968735 [Pavlovales sp. CCMP2436]|mmetsp:Transcript_15882/g.40511  ORF Transcript_15882/g.40511 Transcript_15882/m.40511 type:complete len:200 (-) Transcript_15882:68-667(-)